MPDRAKGSSAPGDAWFCAAFAVFVAAIGAPVLFRGEVLIPELDLAYAPERPGELGPDAVDDAGSDTLEEILPWKTVVHRRVRDGYLPLWNPHAGAGAPLLANNQSMVLAPESWLFMWASPARALSFATLLLLWAGACAAHGFLRIHGARPAAAGAAGVFLIWHTYTAEPANLWILEHTNLGPRNWVFIALAALAWALAGDGSSAARVRPVRAAAAALAIGAMLLAGNLQFAYVGLWLFTAYGIGLGTARRSLVPVGWGAAIIATGLAIGGAQIIPTAELLDLSARSFDASTVAETTARPWAEQLTWVSWTSGAGGIAFAVAGGLQRRRLPAISLAIAAGALWVTSGGLLYRVLYAVLPKFDAFNLDTNLHYVPFSIAWTALVGFGVERVLAAGQRVVAAALLVAVVFPGGALHLSAAYGRYIFSREPLAEPACVSALRSHVPRFGRIVRYRSEALPPNLAALWGIDDLQAYDSFLLEGYSRSIERLEPGAREAHPIKQRMRALRRRETLDSPMLDRFGVTHVLSGEPLQGDLQLVASDPGGYCLSPEKGWWIYTNPGAARRAFFDGSSGTGTGTATVTEHHGDDVLIEVESPGAVLVVTEANAPGWQAFIDGIPATLSTADEIFRAVSVPEGRHEVRLVYRPESFRVGFFVAIAGLFTALVLLPLAAVRFGK